MNPLQEKQAATILIVDDKPANLGVLEHALKEQGYTVLVARDGEMASPEHNMPVLI